MSSDVDWLKTNSGNRFSKHANIRGRRKIIISGMCVLSEKCTLFGDVAMKKDSDAAISMGLFCLLGVGCILEPPQIGTRLDWPPGNITTKTAVYGSLTMGSFVLIRPHCEIRCRQIGRRVVVGRSVVLGRGSEVGDVVIIDANVRVPDRCKIPSFTRVQQHPNFDNAVTFTPLPSSFRKCIENWCKQEYLGLIVDEEKIIQEL
ncbi:LANO_0H19548g1_1 [Lachancea nothofagi CBS 11611]|uniref:Dynactin subunit 5 n=1 Tax=Lachancea nothofagi CBS 11611 TaxID=1266666 RepID=A0A1G4KN59_9SACH|nr:LANO_0H19548g1_1 [Lachancea nothofagi CBS 11611]